MNRPTALRPTSRGGFCIIPPQPSHAGRIPVINVVGIGVFDVAVDEANPGARPGWRAYGAWSKQEAVARMRRAGVGAKRARLLLAHALRLWKAAVQERRAA